MDGNFITDPGCPGLAQPVDIARLLAWEAAAGYMVSIGAQGANFQPIDIARLLGWTRKAPKGAQEERLNHTA